MKPSLLSRALCRALLLAGLVLVGGCAEGLSAVYPGADSEAGGSSRDVCSPDEAGCALSDDGCSPGAIRDSGGQRCAGCEGTFGEVEICGVPVEGRCFDLEAPELCQRCVTDDGRVLYDDCVERADDFSELACESVSYPDDDGGSRSCQVCRDDAGRVVRESCRPDAATCGEVMRGGRACTECLTAEGELAYRECPTPDIDPRRCEVYGNSQGSCTDCYGEDDELLLHECSVIQTDAGAEAPSLGGYCEELADPSGLTCQRCYDPNGGLASETCTETTSGPERCELLDYTDQTCLLCVDGDGEETFTGCEAKSCPEGDTCAPAACTNEYLPNGTLCRTCPVAGSDETQTRCLSDGQLYCETEQEFVSDPNSSGEVQSELCVVCRDGLDGPEVYRHCGLDGSAAATPLCYGVAGQSGFCEVCEDPESGEEVYSSCGPAPPAAFDGQCLEQDGLALKDDEGAALSLPSGEPAVVDCFACGADGGAPPEGEGRCELRASCTSESDGDSVQPVPADPCPALTALYYDPLQCNGDPWGETVGVDGVAGAMAWLLSEHGVVVYTLSDSPVLVSGVCEACDCPRGDRLTLLVSEPDAALLLELELGFYL